jgi:hypothetical protein
VLQYLETLPPGAIAPTAVDALKQRLFSLGKPVIMKDDIFRLGTVEQAEAEKQGLEDFKFASNEEMLAAMGLALEAQP